MSTPEEVQQMIKTLQDAGYTVTKRYDPYTCCICEAPATWERNTQFSGIHRYCTEHAQVEKDFGQDDPSYFFWREVDKERDKQEVVEFRKVCRSALARELEARRQRHQKRGNK